MHLRGGRMENYFVKKLNAPDRDSNLDFPVIISLIYSESSALDHAVTEVGASRSAKTQLISTSSALPEMFGKGEPIKSQNQPSQISAHALYNQKRADSFVVRYEEI
uniref:Uncharacterized protein n=1 Tax=Timema shepardi TaxID=629360 RepID=A0A7R9AU26_TIMSH|nr:unnamed protein product [Timema shepardi]